MKYYLIIGEASRGLYASQLMMALKKQDNGTRSRFFDEGLMMAVGGERVRHLKGTAYVGFTPVLLHLRTISKNVKMCKEDVVR